MRPDFEAYILNLPPVKQQLMFQAHEVITSCSDMIREAFRYMSPFYDYNGMMIYMMPDKKEGIIIGFCNGYKMTDDQGLLSAHDRKMIRHYYIRSFNEKTAEELRFLVFEAMMVQEKLRDFKKRK
jgi:hypothetical protein